MSSTTVIVNARIRTADRARVPDGAVVRDGTVIALGTSAEVRKLAGAGAEVLDARGATLEGAGGEPVARGTTGALVLRGADGAVVARVG